MMLMHAKHKSMQNIDVCMYRIESELTKQTKASVKTSYNPQDIEHIAKPGNVGMKS